MTTVLPNYAFLPDPYGVKFGDWAAVAVEQLSAYAVPTPPDEDQWSDWASYFLTGALPGSPPPEPYGFASWQEWASALIGTQS